MGFPSTPSSDGSALLSTPRTQASNASRSPSPELTFADMIQRVAPPGSYLNQQMYQHSPARLGTSVFHNAQGILNVPQPQAPSPIFNNNNPTNINNKKTDTVEDASGGGSGVNTSSVDFPQRPVPACVPLLGAISTGRPMAAPSSSSRPAGPGALLQHPRQIRERQAALMTPAMTPEPHLIQPIRQPIVPRPAVVGAAPPLSPGYIRFQQHLEKQQQNQQQHSPSWLARKPRPQDFIPDLAAADRNRLWYESRFHPDPDNAVIPPLGPRAAPFWPMVGIAGNGAGSHTTDMVKAIRNIAQGFSANYAGDTALINNRSEDISDAENCSLFLVNLPADLTTHDLLAAIHRLGPSCRIYATHINPPEPGQHPGSAAKVVFLERAAAHEFFAKVCRRGGLPVGSGASSSSSLARVTWNRIKTAEKPHLVASKISRVLIIAGPPAFVNAETLTAFFRSKLEFQIDRIITHMTGHSFGGGEDAVVEYRFGSYRCQAQAARMALQREMPHIRCHWAVDPLSREGWRPYEYYDFNEGY